MKKVKIMHILSDHQNLFYKYVVDPQFMKFFENRAFCLFLAVLSNIVQKLNSQGTLTEIATRIISQIFIQTYQNNCFKSSRKKIVHEQWIVENSIASLY